MGGSRYLAIQRLANTRQQDCSLGCMYVCRLVQIREIEFATRGKSDD